MWIKCAVYCSSVLAAPWGQTLIAFVWTAAFETWVGGAAGIHHPHCRLPGCRKKVIQQFFQFVFTNFRNISTQQRRIVVVVIRYPLLVIKYNINMAQLHSFHLFTQFDLWIFAVMLWLKNDRLKFNLVWIIEHYLEWFLQPILRPNNVH